jgi:hypothetical protein
MHHFGLGPEMLLNLARSRRADRLSRGPIDLHPNREAEPCKPRTSQRMGYVSGAEFIRGPSFSVFFPRSGHQHSESGLVPPSFYGATVAATLRSMLRGLVIFL